MKNSSDGWTQSGNRPHRLRDVRRGFVAACDEATAKGCPTKGVGMRLFRLSDSRSRSCQKGETFWVPPPKLVWGCGFSVTRPTPPNKFGGGTKGKESCFGLWAKPSLGVAGLLFSCGRHVHPYSAATVCLLRAAGAASPSHLRLRSGPPIRGSRGVRSGSGGSQRGRRHRGRSRRLGRG